MDTGLAVGGAAVLCYWPALGSYFVSDDFVWLARARDPWLSLGSLDERWFRPLGLAFWKLTVELLGSSARAHHLCNLAVHLLNCLLLYLLGREILKNEKIGLLAAGIFCLFPIHPEAVTWLSGRFDLLCGFFYLMSLLLLTRHLKDGKNTWLDFSALCCLLALLSKEMALSLPLVAFSLVHHRRPDLRLRQVLRKLWPFFALTLLVLVIRISGSGSLGGYARQFRLEWSSLRLLWSPLEVLFFPWNTALLDSPFRLAGLLFPMVTAIHLWALSQLRTAPRTTAFFAVVLYLTALPLVNLGKVYPNLQDSRYYYLPGAVFALWLASFLVAGRGRRLVIPLYLVALGEVCSLPITSRGERPGNGVTSSFRNWGCCRQGPSDWIESPIIIWGPTSFATAWIWWGAASVRCREEPAGGPSNRVPGREGASRKPYSTTGPGIGLNGNSSTFHVPRFGRGRRLSVHLSAKSGKGNVDRAEERQ